MLVVMVVMGANGNQRPYDEQGWKIPQEGTLQRQVYEYLLEGLTHAQICERMPLRSKNTISNDMWLIRNPVYKRSRWRASRAGQVEVLAPEVRALVNVARKDLMDGWATGDQVKIGEAVLRLERLLGVGYAV